MARAMKKRRNERKQTVKKPPMAAQVMRRRILLIGGSGGASTSAPAAFEAKPFGTPFTTLAVGVVRAAAGATRAAGVVPAGVSVLTVAPVFVAPQSSLVRRAAGSFFAAGRPAAARSNGSTLALSGDAAVGSLSVVAAVGGAFSTGFVFSTGVSKIFSLSKRDLRISADVAASTSLIHSACFESLKVWSGADGQAAPLSEVCLLTAR